MEIPGPKAYRLPKLTLRLKPTSVSRSGLATWKLHFSLARGRGGEDNWMELGAPIAPIKDGDDGTRAGQVVEAMLDKGLLRGKSNPLDLSLYEKVSGGVSRVEMSPCFLYLRFSSARQED